MANHSLQREVGMSSFSAPQSASLAGAIAGTDWPDTTRSREALESMMSPPPVPASMVVDSERLDAAVAAVSDARNRRHAAELAKQRQREAARVASRPRNTPTRHVSFTDISPQSAHNEPEMEF